MMDLKFMAGRKTHLGHISTKEFMRYIMITLMHVDTPNLAALYAESFINDYRDDYTRVLASEIVSREDGFDTVIQITAALCKEGIVSANVPLELKVVQNLMSRGDVREALQTLIENNNLRNAIKVIAANCDWLSVEQINNELLDIVEKHVIMLVN